MTDSPMVEVESVLAELRSHGAHLWVDDGQVRFRAPRGVLTQERALVLREHRAEVVRLLLRGSQVNDLAVDDGNRYEPFPLTEIQSAYVIGRVGGTTLGGTGCHGYGELHFDELDSHRLAASWRAVVERHPMLRAVIIDNQTQRVLDHVPPYDIAVVDERANDDHDALAAVRGLMSDANFDPHAWPLFDLRVTRLGEGDVLHLSIDFLIADFVSIEVLLADLRDHYDPDRTPAPAPVPTFRDYVRADQEITLRQRQVDRLYWLDRIPDLPAAPSLPVISAPSTVVDGVRFDRLQTDLNPATWDAFVAEAGRHGVSPTTAVLAAFAEIMGRWSQQSSFCLTVTTMSRAPLHPDIGRVVGDFTGVSLLRVDTAPDASFAERAAATQTRLWDDLDHRAYSGIDVIREIARQRGRVAALYPVVFTSAIGAEPDDDGERFGRMGFGISHTPQVTIDCQNIVRSGALCTNWDVRRGVFEAGLVEAMFVAYETVLRGLAHGVGWDDPDIVKLPPAMMARRTAVADTAADIPPALLHDAVMRVAADQPGAIALVCADRSVTFGELVARARGVAARIADAGIEPGEHVLITVRPGWQQVVAVFGVLMAGCAYVPVDLGQPASRRSAVRSATGAGLAVAADDESWLSTPDLEVVDVRSVAPSTVAPDSTRRAAVDDVAYVIFTSGSTGVPKGVRITHRSAHNTVQDIVARFDIAARDRALALSALGFDLSVFDLFGVLGAGGALIIPDPSRRGDPSVWATAVQQHAVTIWNSVPVQMEMLLDYLGTKSSVFTPGTIRVVMVSGDWVSVTLPGRARQYWKDATIIALGGATEASIWSIAHEVAGEVPADWPSIPYGRALANQQVYVLDDAIRIRPDLVEGEICIGGVGVALGYLADEAKTAARFVDGGEGMGRLYQTGDRGRYLPDGEIQFRGRTDAQVKIRGHRIEMGEVEAALRRCSGVARAAVVLDGAGSDRRLLAFVEPSPVVPTSAEPDVAFPAARARAAVETTDVVTYRRYLESLDGVAPAVLMQLLLDVGAVATVGDVTTVPKILAAIGPEARHEALCSRWVSALIGHSYLRAQTAGSLRVERFPDDTAVEEGWRRAEEACTADERPLLAYFRASAATVLEQVRGLVDPLTLLFPSGSDEIARLLFSDARFNRGVHAAAAGLVVDRAVQHPSDYPIRVLEVGVGVGGLSAAVLDALAERGVAAAYTCTDLSPAALNQARARLGNRPGVDYAVLDIDADPHQQGFAPGSFDIVVAGDVLHASQDPAAAIRALVGLAGPGAALVVVEMTQEHPQTLIGLELLARSPIADTTVGPQASLFRDEQEWTHLLVAAGAARVTAVPRDGVSAASGMVALVATLKTDRALLDPRRLRDELADQLPDYMVPSQILVLDDLPLNSNNKLDRAAFASWIPVSGDRAIDAVGTANNELEASLATLWARELRISRIGPHDNLFTAGGDSLVAARLAGIVAEQIPAATGLFFDRILRCVLEQPTVADLARYIETEAMSIAADASAVAAPEPGPATDDVIQRMPSAAGMANTMPLVIVYSDSASESVAAAVAGQRTPVHRIRLQDVAGGDRAQVAARWTTAIASLGAGAVDLVAVGYAATVTLAIGTALLEQGVLVNRLVLLSPTQPAGGGILDAYVGDVTLVAEASTPDEPWASACLGDFERATPAPEGLFGALAESVRNG